MASKEIELLLTTLDQAFDTKSWHGTNLRGSLRGITAEQASWRPADDRHNIWELTLHCAYWKYVVWRRLRGEKRGSFPRKGSDWFPRPGELGAEEWKEDLALLTQTHRSLREAVAGLSATRLHQKVGTSGFTAQGLISGVAAHDLYHAGQIQLLKRLGAKS